MTPSLRERTDQILDRILDAVEERKAPVEEVVRSLLRDEPEEVRERVAPLLPHLFVEADLLEAGVFGLAPDLGARLAEVEEASTRDFDLGPGDLVGAYRLIEEIGRGGMGVVFLAERADDQYRQRVAVKLLSSATHGRVARDRFLRERQFLADLTHPCIARLLDGGVTEAGDPYLVMELIRGQPIDRYCADRDLSISERIALFLDVCDAVQTAHRKLIVHRDLKPANILVGDGGQVKLLDFGIASLLEADGAEVSTTQTMMRAFTPEYASPEQLRGERAAVPSDIYSLGVLLHCLLVGRPPIEIRGLDLVEATRLLVEHEPVPPSRTLRSAHGTAGARARARRVRGDLDNVTLKALAKDPDARYGSVAELASDLRSFLVGLPVAARSPTAGYRARKFLTRHRWGVGAAFAVFVALAFGLLMTAVQSRKTAVQRDLAQTEAVKAGLVAGFLVDLFGAADPFVEQEEEPTVRQLLERAERRIDAELMDVPAARAELLSAIGRSYRGLGDLARAQLLMNESVDLLRLQAAPDPELFAEVLIEAALTVSRRDFDSARALLEEALELLDRSERALPRLHARALATLAQLGDTKLVEKERLFRAAIDRYREAGDEASPEVANLLQNLGSVLEGSGDFEGSVRLKRESLTMIESTLGRDHPMYFQVTNNLGHVLVLRGDLVDAEQHYRRAVEGLERRLGPAHPGLANPYSNLGKVLIDVGRPVEAVVYIEGAARIGSAEPGQSFSTAGQQINLATLRREQGRTEEALLLYRQAREFLREHLPVGHRAVARVDSLLGQTLRIHGDETAALERLEQALATQADSPPSDRALAETRRHLGGLLCRQGDVHRGRNLVDQGCEGFENFEADPIRSAECSLERVSCELALGAARQGSLDRAERVLVEALPPDHFLRRRLRLLQHRIELESPP